MSDWETKRLLERTNPGAPIVYWGEEKHDGLLLTEPKAGMADLFIASPSYDDEAPVDFRIVRAVPHWQPGFDGIASWIPFDERYDESGMGEKGDRPETYEVVPISREDADAETAGMCLDCHERRPLFGVSPEETYYSPLCATCISRLARVIIMAWHGGRFREKWEHPAVAHGRLVFPHPSYVCDWCDQAEQSVFYVRLKHARKLCEPCAKIVLRAILSWPDMDAGMVHGAMEHIAFQGSFDESVAAILDDSPALNGKDDSAS